MRWRCVCRDLYKIDRNVRKNRRHLVEQGTHSLMCKYKEWGNMRCFENPIIVSGFVLFNILYGIMKRLCIICGCRHGWSNHVKTLCTFL